MADGKAANGVASQNGVTTAPAKTKGKKNGTVQDKGEILRQKILQLEQTEAADREQEAEIEREVKKASRELTNTISNLDPIAKVNRLQKECSELLAKLKRLEKEQIKTKRRADLMSKERDATKSELNTTKGLKAKLESLSRDTTNDNRKLRAEINRFKEESHQFEEQIRDRVDSSTAVVEELLEEKEQAKDHGETVVTDELFRQKFQSWIDQYNLRELHFNSQLRCKELEIQYHVARLEQQRRAQEMESTRSNQLTRQVSTFSQTETELRSQLNIYVEKFKQVEDTLNSSNDLFLTFRKEMEEMSKKTKRLEKENLALTRKHEATNQSVIKMAEERNRTHKELELLRKKNENLEKLCRGMQAQGRGQPFVATTSIPHPAAEAQAGLDEEDGTESEYDDYDDEDVSLDEDYDGNDSDAAVVRHDMAPVMAKQIVFGSAGTAQPGAKAGVKV